MGFPMNSQRDGGNSILARYLAWLASRLQETPGQAVQQITGIGPATTISSAPILNVPSAPATQEPRTSGGVSARELMGASGQNWTYAPGGWQGMTNYDVRDGVAVRTPYTSPAPITPSPVKREDLLGYLQQYLNVGGYFPPGLYPQSRFKDIETAYDEQQKGYGERTHTAVYNPRKLQYEQALEANPNDKDAQKMLGLFAQIEANTPVETVLDVNWELQPGEVAILKEFAADYAKNQNALSEIAAIEFENARRLGLPMPDQQWDINPDIVAQLWTQQKDGLTEAQAQERELRAAQEALPYFKPRTREKIKSDLMREYTAKEKVDKQVFDLPPNVRAEMELATREAYKTGGTADAAERAATKMSNEFYTPDQKKAQEELAKRIEEEVWKEGYAAMRGEKVKGGAEYRRVKEAESRVLAAKDYEIQLAEGIARKMEAELGRPYDVALREAKAYVESRSKKYNYPGGPTSGYLP